MSNWVLYQGKPIGKITLSDDNTRKLVYVAEGLESLATLFSLNPNDVVSVEGRDDLKFSDFKTQYLQKITGFYPDIETWLLRNERAFTVEQLDSEEDGRGG